MKKKNIILTVIIALVAIVLIVAVAKWNSLKNDEKEHTELANKYIAACNLKDDYKYREALEIFEDLDGFEKSDRYVKEIKEIIDTPVAQVDLDAYYVTLNLEGEIISIDMTEKNDIPVLEGLDITTAEVGQIIDFGNKDTKEKILDCIRAMKETGILDDVTVMNFSDINGVTFNYQSRFDVFLGTPKDLLKKISLFKEMVEQQEPTARGTVDLSKTGKAIYIP